MPTDAHAAPTAATLDVAATHRPLLLISANSVWNILNFRMELIRALQQAGYRVAVAAPDGGESGALVDQGITFHPIAMDAGGTSPIRDAALLARYWSLLRTLKPHAFLGFTAKPNIYGSIAARLCGIPVINNLTGLGTSFIHGSALERLLSSLYRVALRRSRAVFFHNQDDRDLFLSRGLVEPGSARVIPGSGVDLDRFAPAELTRREGGLTFLFVGRLLREKGVEEFAEAAALVKSGNPGVHFQILGGFAEGSRGVPRALVEQWVEEGRIAYLGAATDVRGRIEAADCIVLPSYREGLPRVLLEAAAMGRPAIASDVPGCRQAVVDDVTGFLCTARSGEALAVAMERMIALPETQRETIGRSARAHAEEHFGVERVWMEYLSVLRAIDMEPERKSSRRSQGQ